MATKKTAAPKIERKPGLSSGNKKQFKTQSAYLAHVRREVKLLMMKSRALVKLSGDLPTNVRIKLAASLVALENARELGTKVWGKA